MAKTHQRNLARELYIETNLTAKQIAAQVGVNENTVGKWIEDPKENWKDLKSAKNVTSQQIIAKKYTLLNKLVTKNLEKQETGELTAADIDAEHKLSMSIKALTKGETLSGYIQSFTPFLTWLQSENPALAKQVADVQQKFLLTKAEELA